MREYKIYLPLKYNDGAAIEPEKFRNLKSDLVARFGAITVSSLTAPYQGTWKYGGVEFLDDIITIEIVSRDDRATKRFFKDLKERLKQDLRQIDILITTHGIQVI
jgi:hypothetical protein